MVRPVGAGVVERAGRTVCTTSDLGLVKQDLNRTAEGSNLISHQIAATNLVGKH